MRHTTHISNKAQLMGELRELCENTSQTSVAKLIGISVPYLSDVMNGKREPGTKISEHFGFTKTVHCTNEYKYEKIK